MDRIFINKLLVRSIIGINADERDKPQDILISVELFTDLQPAGQSDDIARTINYRTVVKRIMAYAESARRFTVEALAEDIAGICFDYPAVASVCIRVEKPAAARFAETVGIEIERSRPG
jgi:FolB domain-containing protein